MRSFYRLALHLMPAELRRKHGAAMESLFAHALTEARARGPLHAAVVGVSGIWDVVRRAVYEGVRPQRAGLAPWHPGDPLMPLPTSLAILRRCAVTFAFAFTALTVALLFLYGRNVLPGMSAKGTAAGDMALVLLYAVPFTAAMTIPMAVLLAVLSEFSTLGANGTLAAARRTRDGVRRLIIPVLWAAVGVAALAFLVTAELVPRSNARLSAALGVTATATSDRLMTIGALRDAARNVGSNATSRAEPVARAQVAAYEVEVQKKIALPAACVVLALAGMAMAFAMPRGGQALVVGGSLVMYIAYYMLLITGENLADHLVVSPFVGMWAANALVLTAALMVMWWRRSVMTPGDGGALLIDG